ncbi:MAG: hypothetical protein Q4C47_08150 [Planctomycetia bacterium]|nr:hypothetical protein [Planctomycetia bacterium]
MSFHQNPDSGPWTHMVRRILKPALSFPAFLLATVIPVAAPGPTAAQSSMVSRSSTTASSSTTAQSSISAQGEEDELDDLGLTSAPASDDPYRSRCAPRRGSPDCEPIIFGRVDVLALRRDIRQNTPLLWNQTTAIAQSGDLNEKYSVGPRVMLGMRILPKTTVEVTWFDQRPWDDTDDFYDTLGNLYTPFGEAGYPIPGVDPTDQTRITSRSYLSNLELNVRQHFVINDNYNIRSSLFAGPRYIKFDDRMGYSLDGTTSLLGAQTTNDIFGGQVGGSLDFAIGRNCWISFVGAGGIAGNSYHLGQWYDGTYNERSESQTTYFGDLDVSFLWRFRPWMAVTLGYKAIWIDNVTTAAQNFGTDWDAFQSAMTTIDDRTDAVFHGPHAGCEFRF